MIPLCDSLRPHSRWARITIALAVGLAALSVVRAAPLLALNGAAVWLFGENVEDRMGPLRFASLVALATLLGLVPQAIANGDGMLVAASTAATACVAGAQLRLFPFAKTLLAAPALATVVDLVEVPALALHIVWVALILIGHVVDASSIRDATMLVLERVLLGAVAGFVVAPRLASPPRCDSPW